MDEFMRELNSYIGKIPKQTIKTIKGQFKAGDIDGAKLGFNKVKGRLERNGGTYENFSSQLKKR